MTCKHLMNGAPDCVFCHRDQLQQEVNGLLVENSNLRGVRDQLLADHQQYVDWASPQLERLGREMKENERLRALLTQAPIAKVTVQDKWPYPSVSVELYAPGLPPGEYDLYLMPDVPQPGEQT